MNRGLLHLLLCLVLAFTGTPAWAHCRPENRVGGSPVFSSNFTLADNAQPVAVSGENEGCGYDFASGVHKYLYAQDNPVNMSDPSGRNTVLIVTDSGNTGASDVDTADKAANHLVKVGWTVKHMQMEDFVNNNAQFNGVIFSGHGDEGQSASIPISVAEQQMTSTHSKLDVAAAFSCHGFDFISKISRDGYTTSTALVMGYWGYSVNTSIRNWRIGRDINKWVANPTYTSISYGNLLQDGAGQIIFGVPAAVDDYLQGIDWGVSVPSFGF